MIKAKQVQGLSDFMNHALVSASQAQDGTVTLTRGDGFTLEFDTGNGTSGTQGDKGPTGDKGPDGYGAYELAVNAGYSGTEAQWRASLKGDTGDSGTNGSNGATGDAGITPTFQTTVSVTNTGVGANPIVTRNTVTNNATTQTYSLSLGIPQGKKGNNGTAGTSYSINTTGSISKSNTQAASAAAASISWNGTVGTINITVPTGTIGDTGGVTAGTNGNTPTLSSVSKGTDLSAGSTSWTCTRSGTPKGGATSYTIALSQAAKGDTGAQGASGPRGNDAYLCKAVKDNNKNWFPFGDSTAMSKIKTAQGSIVKGKSGYLQFGHTQYGDIWCQCFAISLSAGSMSGLIDGGEEKAVNRSLTTGNALIDSNLFIVFQDDLGGQASHNSGGARKTNCLICTRNTWFDANDYNTSGKISEINGQGYLVQGTYPNGPT